MLQKMFNQKDLNKVLILHFKDFSVGGQKKGGKPKNQTGGPKVSGTKPTGPKTDRKPQGPRDPNKGTTSNAPKLDGVKENQHGEKRPKKHFVNQTRDTRQKDHHVSGTGRPPKEVKKQGGGSRNWGNAEKDVEFAVKGTETTEEEKPVEKPVEKVKEMKDMTPEEKKEFRKKRKEAEKKAKKTGKKDDKKDVNPNDVTYDSLKEVKEDPNQKTFEEYQKERQQKLKQMKGDETTEEEKPVEKKEEKKKAVTASDLFKAPTQSNTSSQDKDQKKGGDPKKAGAKKPKSTKKAPNVNDKNAFPALKI
jgi:hypothetical protein